MLRTALIGHIKAAPPVTTPRRCRRLGPLRRSAPVVVVLAIATLLPVLAAASVYGFLDQGAIRYFRGDDAQLMSRNLDAVLADADDNAAQEWHNPNTGSHGRAEVLKAFEHDGMRCRRVRVSNHAQGIDGVSTADMCEVDGAWKVLRLPE